MKCFKCGFTYMHYECNQICKWHIVGGEEE